MADQQTEKSRYISKYSPGQFVTAAQYIVETLCENKARKDKKELPNKFWQLKEWEKFYKSQLRIVNKLVKQYSGNCVTEFLKKNNWIYSLQAKWAQGKLAEFAQTYREPESNIVESQPTEKTYRKNIVKSKVDWDGEE